MSQLPDSCPSTCSALHPVFALHVTVPVGCIGFIPFLPGFRPFTSPVSLVIVAVNVTDVAYVDGFGVEVTRCGRRSTPNGEVVGFRTARCSVVRVTGERCRLRVRSRYIRIRRSISRRASDRLVHTSRATGRTVRAVPVAADGHVSRCRSYAVSRPRQHCRDRYRCIRAEFFTRGRAHAGHVDRGRDPACDNLVHAPALPVWLLSPE